MCLPANCMARVEAFESQVGVQYLCKLYENCRHALTAARTRRRAWIALNKEGQDMIMINNKRIELLKIGDNVRIPISSVDRAPLCPISLVGAVLGVSSTGSILQLGMKHKIAIRYSHSEVTPCDSYLLLAPAMCLKCSHPLDLLHLGGRVSPYQMRLSDDVPFWPLQLL